MKCQVLNLIDIELGQVLQWDFEQEGLDQVTTMAQQKRPLGSTSRF